MVTDEVDNFLPGSLSPICHSSCTALGLKPTVLGFSAAVESETMDDLRSDKPSSSLVLALVEEPPMGFVSFSRKYSVAGGFDVLAATVLGEGFE
jgi:hypothetical protein